MTFPGPISDYDLLLRWATDKCIPLVREITFQNAEVTDQNPGLTEMDCNCVLDQNDQLVGKLSH